MTAGGTETREFRFRVGVPDGHEAMTRDDRFFLAFAKTLSFLLQTFRVRGSSLQKLKDFALPFSEM